jgi:hypothetical protein
VLLRFVYISVAAGMPSLGEAPSGGKSALVIFALFESEPPLPQQWLCTHTEKRVV